MQAEVDMLPVNEVFETIQGEAHWTGKPSVFLRLQGCAVGCPWCDTRHTWALDPAAEVSAATMMAKAQDAPTFARMTVAEILGTLAGYSARHLVITGGEPAAHSLWNLSVEAIRQGWSVQLETSGTQPIRIAPGAWVTLSPKLDMPGGFDVRADAWRRADEIKVPVGKVADIERVLPLLELRRPGVDVWLQPLSASPKATALAMAECIARNWRLSVQTHKFIGVR